MLRTRVAVALAVALLVGPTTALAADTMTTVDAPVVATASATRVLTPRRATIISDSAMAGVRWNGALGGFRGFAADARLESCRRLVDSSCRGREGYRPTTALTEITRLSTPGPDDVLVIAVGYNDIDTRFAVQARQVLDAAVGHGFSTIAWVTYREDVSYRLPSDTRRAISNYRSMNAELRAIVATGAFPQLQLWDLDEYSRATPGWFTSDGVHELRRGSWGVADWISRKMAFVSGLPCPMPWTPTSLQDQPCVDPNAVRPARGYPDIDGLYEL